MYFLPIKYNWWFVNYMMIITLGNWQLDTRGGSHLVRFPIQKRFGDLASRTPPIFCPNRVRRLCNEWNSSFPVCIPSLNSQTHCCLFSSIWRCCCNLIQRKARGWQVLQHDGESAWHHFWQKLQELGDFFKAAARMRRSPSCTFWAHQVKFLFLGQNQS